MDLSRIVDQIISKRNAKLPTIEQKREELYNILKALDAYDDLKNQIVDAGGNALEGKYKYLSEKNPEMIFKLSSLDSAGCRKKVEAALTECDKVYNRFSRNNISISVVGKARIGKSLFLQGVSNLNDLVIPAFTETDCTGAVSIIENKPGIDLEAHLQFKSEEQMIETVQTYLDKIIPPENGRMVIRTLSQIGDVKLLDEVEKKMVSGRADNVLLRYLKDYVTHYNDWAPLVHRKTLTLYKDTEIQEYVAQNDGNSVDTKYFYKYLAVDTCRIFCTFDYKDAGKITLIDTVGLGNNSLGIENDMVEVVNDRSDAVVFLHLPYSPAGGYVDSEIAKAYNLIESNCRNRDLNKWLFWLINEAPGHPKTPNDRARCEACVKTLEGNGWHGAMTRIVNVKEKEQVRDEFLIPMLNILMSNLDDIDSLYTSDLTASLEAVRKEFNTFCGSAKKVMSSELNTAANILPQMNIDIDKIQRTRKGLLKDLATEEKEMRNLPCDKLHNRVNQIIQEMKANVITPNRQEVLEQLHYADPVNIYTDYCNSLRNEVTQRFTCVDGTLAELVEAVKNKIAQVLSGEDGCRLGRIVSVSQDKPYEWLKDFADLILDPSLYPNLNAAFTNVYQFDFSVRGFMTYEVRACLDKIDPQITNPPHLIGETNSDTAEWICFWLERNLMDVAEEVEANLQELFCKPHRAFFAIIKEFSDKVDFAENVKYEWDRLYSENYSVIWSEKFKNLVAANTAFSEWNDMLSKLLSCNSRCAALSVI